MFAKLKHFQGSGTQPHSPKRNIEPLNAERTRWSGFVGYPWLFPWTSIFRKNGQLLPSQIQQPRLQRLESLPAIGFCWCLPWYVLTLKTALQWIL